MKIVLLGFLIFVSTFLEAKELLPSWNESNTRTSVITYVQTVTDEKSGDFIPKEDRIAVFDNDGTLWSEQPIYFQLLFAIDRVKALSPQHPEWKKEEPFKFALENDLNSIMKGGSKAILKLLIATHTGMNNEEFDEIVTKWIKTAKHPTKKVHYTELVYQPMLELLNYLRSNGFKTFIVSGGGIDFMRPWASKVYGIPSSQIIGSQIQVKYKNRKIIREAKLNFIDDKAGKPVGIHYHIGKRPVAAFGNSDGDLDMMQYTEANKKYKTLELYVHHTDGKREWAYDRESHIGKLDKGLDYAKLHQWSIVDMKNDWKVIYPFELKK
jgi:phosphoserine phosphatase